MKVLNYKIDLTCEMCETVMSRQLRKNLENNEDWKISKTESGDTLLEIKLFSTSQRKVEKALKEIDFRIKFMSDYCLEN